MGPGDSRREGPWLGVLEGGLHFTAVACSQRGRRLWKVIQPVGRARAGWQSCAPTPLGSRLISPLFSHLCFPSGWHRQAWDTGAPEPRPGGAPCKRVPNARGVTVCSGMALPEDPNPRGWFPNLHPELQLLGRQESLPPLPWPEPFPSRGLGGEEMNQTAFCRWPPRAPQLAALAHAWLGGLRCGRSRQSWDTAIPGLRISSQHTSSPCCVLSQDEDTPSLDLTLFRRGLIEASSGGCRGG